MTCIFCQIVEGKAPCHKVWEDEHHLAFLSIFPNTDGFTVVIPKKTLPQLRVRSTTAGVSGPDAGDPKSGEETG